MRSALPELIGEGLDREGFFKQRLGMAFKARVGRRYGDVQYRIEHPGDDLHGKVSVWKVGLGGSSTKRIEKSAILRGDPNAPVSR